MGNGEYCIAGQRCADALGFRSLEEGFRFRA